MNGMDFELLGQAWVGGDDGGLVRAVYEIERTDTDEVRVGVEVDGAEAQHFYLAPDRAMRLAMALIFEASREWRI